MITCLVFIKLKGRYFGSVLGGSDVKIMNAYGWGVQFRKRSLTSLVARYLGVFHLGARMRNRILENVIDKLDVNYDSLFDAACGVGLASMYYSGKFRKIYAVDEDKQKIKEAKIIARDNKIKNIKFEQLDLLGKNLPREKFEVVICFEVIEHVDDGKKLVKNLSKLVKNGGYLILSFPSNTLLSRMAQKALDHHRVGYLPTHIKKMLPGTGLKVVEELSFGKSVLGKSVVMLDFFFRKSFPLLASLFFPIAYSLLIFDYYLPISGKPRGYILVLSK